MKKQPATSPVRQARRKRGNTIAARRVIVAGSTTALLSLIYLQFATVANAQESDSDATESATPFELRLGPFDFHTKLRTAATYDDNINFDSESPESDFFYVIEPRLIIYAGDRLALLSMFIGKTDVLGVSPQGIVTGYSGDWPGKLLALDYAPRWEIYSRHSEENTLAHTLNFNALWPMAKLVLGVHQTYTREEVPIIEAAGRSRTESLGSEISAAYQISQKTSVSISLNRSSTDYPGSTNLIGNVDWSATGNLNYQLTPTLNVGLTAAGGVAQVSSGQDQQFARLGLRMSFYVSDLVSLNASFSGEYRELTDGGSSSFSPVFSLGASYVPWARGSFSLTAQRSQHASIFDGNYYVSTSGGFSFGQGITDRLSTSLSLSYYYTEYKAVAGAETPDPTDYYSARFNFTVRLWKRLESRGFYEHRGRGLATDLETKDNLAGVELVLSY